MSRSSNIEDFFSQKRQLKKTSCSLGAVENKTASPKIQEDDQKYFGNVMQKTEDRLLTLVKNSDFGPDKEQVFCSVARKYLSDMSNLIFYSANTRQEKFKTGKSIGERLVLNGMLEWFCKMVLNSQKDLPVLSEAATICCDITLDLMNYSESVSEAFMNYKGMLQYITDGLEMWTQSMFDGNLPEGCLNNLLRFVTLVHNSCMSSIAVVTLVRSTGILSILKKIIMFPDLGDENGMMVVAAIADVMDETDSSSVIQTSDKWITKFIEYMKYAIDEPGGDYCGWFAFECGRVLRQLSCFDANKKKLVELGVLPALVKLTKMKEEICEFEAVSCFSQLAFDPYSQKIMTEDPGCEAIPILLEKATSSEFENIREIAYGTIWTMSDKLKGTKYWSLVKKLFSKKSKGHIMISYSREQRHLLLNVRKELEKQNFEVWMDVDQMRGDVYDRMAEAVENAAVVILGMSRSYKLSEYCRREAAYAGKLNKQVIPLKVEVNYDPDGWLGIMTAGMFFYDFGRKSFDETITKLIKDLQRRAYRKGEDTPQLKPGQATPTSSVPLPPPIVLPPPTPSLRPQKQQMNDGSGNIAKEDFRKFDREAFEKWLDLYGLPRKNFENLRPKDLLYLARMKDEAPESYHTLGRKLFKDKTDPFLKTRIMADLTDALEDLS